MSLDRMTAAEIADEYVLGLLDAAEAAEVERRLERDGELASLVAVARNRALEVDLTAAPVEPPRELWSRIERAIDSGSEGDDLKVRELPAEAPPRHRADAGRRTVDRRRRRADVRAPLLSAPRLAAIAAICIAFVALGAVGGRFLLSPDPVVVAVLLNDAGEPFALVEGQEDNTTRITVLADADVPEGQVLQVWTKPDPDGPPVSLGILDRPSSATVERGDLPTPTIEQLYEITVEQQGGSATGLPTGPILGKGLAREPR